MDIKFQTKEESKQQQLEAFLKLSGGERVWRFFWLSHQINRLPRKQKNEKSDNFIIHINIENAD